MGKLSGMVYQHIGKPFALHHISLALHRSVIPDGYLKPYAKYLRADEVLKYMQCINLIHLHLHDTELTWRGEWPQFTSCFHHSVLVWVMCGYLWLLSPFYVYYLALRPVCPLPITALFIVKLFSCCGLFILKLIQLLNTLDDSSSSNAEISDYVIHMVTYLLLMAILHMEKRKGVIASPVLFFFWVLSVLGNIIPFYTKIKLEENEDDVFGFSLFYVVYGLIVISFLASCFAEKIPPGSFNTNGNREVAASVPSRMTFWWSTGMLIQGIKGLEEQHMIPLNPRDTTSTTVPVFQAYLKEEEKHKYLRRGPEPEQLESSFFAQMTVKGPSRGKKRKPNSEEKTPLLQAESNGLYVNTEPNEDSSHMGSNSKSRVGKRSGGGVSIFRVIMKTFWRQILSIHSIMLLQTAALLFSPQLMRLMIEFASDFTEPTWKGYVYAVGMFVLTVIQSTCRHICIFYTTCLALRISGSITSAVYRKAMTMNSEARRESTVGEIVNLMSVDAHNIEMYTTYSFFLWTSPLIIIVALYLLYTTVGVSMFAGLAVMAALFILNTWLMDKQRVYQKDIMKIRDKRVKVINEVLNGIKILKLYAWEPSFEDKVTKVRNQELSILFKTLFIDSFSTFSWTAAFYWMMLFTFLTYVCVDDSHTLDASTSFVAFSYFNTIRRGVNLLPIMIREGVKSIVSMRRIDKYLNTPDLDDSKLSRGSENSDDAITVSQATFSWDSGAAPTLNDINLQVKRGSLVAVVGTVGVGKSSLMSAMLGEMDVISGHVDINGSVAYVPQQAWIQNDTLRNNVLFGRDFDPQRYDRVLEACALKPDLEILAAGDMTEIGEKGINLSGGQKQRVSVARAVYNDADIILLDDPLSAVDSHVGKHMFNEVISNNGFLRGKTRVLVTHGLQWLPKADCIVVLSEGRISEMGTYDELTSHDGPFAQFLTTYLTQQDDSYDDEDEEAQDMKRTILEKLVGVQSESDTDKKSTARILQRLKSQEAEDGHHQGARHRTRSRGKSESSLVSSHRHDNEKEKKEEMEGKDKLMTEEELETGRVDIGVYKELAKALGYKFSVLMMVLYTLYNVASLGGSMWLSAWTDNTELSNTTALPTNSSRRKDLNDFYLGIYATLGVVQTLFVVTYSVIMAFRHIHASRQMHQKMLNRLLQAPMSFFDTTPLGRIVNRFSQDMDMLDSQICLDVEIWFASMERALSSMVAISYTTPVFLAVFFPAFIIYYAVLRFYVGTSCQLRRLQSLKRSPIYSHFGETLTGTHVIRAYTAQQRFIAESEKRVDTLLTCSYNYNAAARWLGLRLDFLGSILVLAAAIFVVLSRDSLSAGVVGLSLSYALEVTGYLNSMVIMYTQMETNIVSLERIVQYTKVDTEADWTVFPRPKPGWPQHGRVRFQDYSTRYRPGLDLVLKDLTCDIKPGEKVGIVGRTGAGKSSLTLALFRLIESAGGSVLVDDVNIASLGLHDLRNNLNILPQDPVIFDGTIRMNLDPLERHSDQQVWTALEQAHLKSYVQGLPDLLNHVCGEGGENLSVGQRQLLCLARALLRKTKILVLDEATAAVDMETDDLIQNTIRQAFSDCTILTIAHRINTVMDYDRILVMDSGQIVESDTPHILLQDPNTVFYKMAKDAGLV